MAERQDSEWEINKSTYEKRACRSIFVLGAMGVYSSFLVLSPFRHFPASAPFITTSLSWTRTPRKILIMGQPGSRVGACADCLELGPLQRCLQRCSPLGQEARFSRVAEGLGFLPRSRARSAGRRFAAVVRPAAVSASRVSPSQDRVRCVVRGG